MDSRGADFNLLPPGSIGAVENRKNRGNHREPSENRPRFMSATPGVPTVTEATGDRDGPFLHFHPAIKHRSNAGQNFSTIFLQRPSVTIERYTVSQQRRDDERFRSPYPLIAEFTLPAQR